MDAEVNLVGQPEYPRIITYFLSSEYLLSPKVLLSRLVKGLEQPWPQFQVYSWPMTRALLRTHVVEDNSRLQR